MMVSRVTPSPVRAFYPANMVCSAVPVDVVRFAAETPRPWVTWKRVKATGFAAAFFALGFVSRGTWDRVTTPPPFKVVSVHDGDTFKTANGESIRMYGIDAPELKQRFGPEAQAYLESLIQGKTVTLKRKGQSYNRTVYVVMVGSLDINREMVRVGLAFEEPRYAKGEYKDAEAQARKAKTGVWTQKDGGERPWTFRERTRGKKTAMIPLQNQAPVALAIFPENHPEALRLIPFEEIPRQVAADLRRRTHIAMA